METTAASDTCRSSSSDNPLSARIGVAFIDDTHVEDLSPPPPPLPLNLSLHISQWAFWCKFAAFPVVLLIVNGLVLGTLVVLDEYEFRSRHEPKFVQIYYPMHDPYLKMLRYNAAVFAKLLGLDAIVLFVAALLVRMQVAALNNVDDDDDKATTPATLWNRRHIYAQVSRKLDILLRRSRRRCENRLHKRSILVSLLLLASAFCASFAIQSLAEWRVTWTTAAKLACPSQSDQDIDSFYNPRRNRENDIPGIPLALQSWAKVRNNVELERLVPQTSLVQLLDGTIYMVVDKAPMPPTPLPHSASKDEESAVVASRRDEMKRRYQDQPILAAIVAAHGTLNNNRISIQYMYEATWPHSFVLLNDTDASSTEPEPPNAHENANANAPAFCCLYKQPPYNRLAMLCADVADTSELLDTTEVRNVTLDHYAQEAHANRRQDPLFVLQYASIQWYRNCVWIMLSWQSPVNSRFSFVEYVNVTVETGQPLQLVPVANRTKGFWRGQGEFHAAMNSYEMIGGATTSCEQWRRYIQVGSLVPSLLLSAYGLWWYFDESAAIVLAYTAVAIALACISKSLAAAVGILVAAASMVAVTLQGVGGHKAAVAAALCRIPLKSEQATWLLYTAMILTVNIATQRPDTFAGIALVACVVVGSILGHPTMFLVGWVGGIGLVLFGIFVAIVRDLQSGLAMVGVGTVGGAGCVTVGRLLMQCRPYMSHYSKRGWIAARERLRAVSWRCMQASTPSTTNIHSSIGAGPLRTDD